MKTLDEVIKALQKNADREMARWNEETCFISEENLLDALHYLREYRTLLPLVPSLINTAIEVQKKGKTIG